MINSMPWLKSNNACGGLLLDLMFDNKDKVMTIFGEPRRVTGTVNVEVFLGFQRHIWTVGISNG